MCFNGIKGSKKGKSRYKTMNRKAVLQLTEQKNQWKSFKNVWLKIELFSVQMLEEMTVINRETVRSILVEDLKKKKVCARFVPHLLTLDQKHQSAALSVEFVEMIDDDKNVLKRIVTGDES
jgi:hypothetical protein